MPLSQIKFFMLLARFGATRKGEVFRSTPLKSVSVAVYLFFSDIFVLARILAPFFLKTFRAAVASRPLQSYHDAVIASHPLRHPERSRTFGRMPKAQGVSRNGISQGIPPHNIP